MSPHLSRLGKYGFYHEVKNVSRPPPLNQVQAVVDLKESFHEDLVGSSVLLQIDQVLRPIPSQIQAVVGLKDPFPDDLKRLSVHP